MGDSGLAYVSSPAAVGLPVLVLHSWWGLTSSFIDYADRLAAHGFLAGCVDLYDGRLARIPEDAAALRSAPRRQPMYRMLLSGIDDLVTHRSASVERIGLVGFSMGGHWALWLAQRHDVAAGALVVHYATRAVTTSGEPVPVLAHYAEQDTFVTASGRRTMERSFVRQGWPYVAIDHPKTGHGFAESAEKAYDPVAANSAFAASCRHLQANLSTRNIASRP